MVVKTPDWLKHALFYQIFRVGSVAAPVGPMHCARNRTLRVLTTPPAISKKGRSGNG